jgi:hypothetical protein
MPVILPLKRFLQIEQCPTEWRNYNLYLFRDGELAFYAGQSYVAFDRVWTHIRDGFRARSVVGRFLLANWPASMRYVVELLSAGDEQFDEVAHDLDAAERQLIERYAPCFNATLNRQPTPLPASYAPPSAPLRCSRNINHLIREAGIAVNAEERRRFLRENES